jgi:DNA-binding response OmpR family regulator
VGSTFCFKLPISPLSSPSLAGAGRWVDDDWVFRERTSWPNLPKLPYQQRVILYDETDNLYALFTAYFDDIEFVDTDNLAQVEQELQHSPAHAVILNTVSPHSLAPMVEQARSEISDTPIIGCSLPPRVDPTVAAGAAGRLIKPVRQADLEAVMETVGPVSRVLVVDDNPDILQLFRRMLHIYDDTLEVLTASSGEAALNELRLRQPDLMLLDIVLPDLDGWQVLEHIKKDGAIESMPVIVVSAEDVLEQTMSDVLLATMGQGLSINQVLRCSLQLSKLLLEPG